MSMSLKSSILHVGHCVLLAAVACEFLAAAASAADFTAGSAGIGQVWQPSLGDKVVRISGIYPHLAVFNGYGECGMGAVMPWADKLWFITYPPHKTQGSEDKLYTVDKDLKLEIRPESVGGTHANRLIHRESNQLIIGPYLIDATGKVRALDLKQLQTAEGQPRQVPNPRAPRTWACSRSGTVRLGRSLSGTSSPR